MQKQKFSHATSKQLKNYVYLYIDPRDRSVFYVGKGKGNRCFSHLADTRETDKRARIRNIRKSGLEPIVEILRHGLTTSEAMQVESAAIDLIGLDKLTNVVLGHHSSSVGRSGISQLSALLDAKPVIITHPSILININKSFYHGMGIHEIYDATRCAWPVNPDKKNPKYAMSVYRSVIREVFEISGWIEGGSTMKSGDINGRAEPRPGRKEFVGQRANDEILKLYVGKSVSRHWAKGSRFPIRYVACE